MGLRDKGGSVMDWQTVVIVLLVVWAGYHTMMEMQQDRRIENLERKLERFEPGEKRD